MWIWVKLLSHIFPLFPQFSINEDYLILSFSSVLFQTLTSWFSVKAFWLTTFFSHSERCKYLFSIFSRPVLGSTGYFGKSFLKSTEWLLAYWMYRYWELEIKLQFVNFFYCCYIWWRICEMGVCTLKIAEILLS